MSSNTQPAYESYPLGETVWESDPWERKVHRRTVIQIVTTEWLPVVGSPPKVTRQVRVSGGVLGIGETLSQENWGTRYFDDREAARRACCEQAVKLEAERRSQITDEIARLQEELSRVPK